jgi:hypothetical protein
LAVRCTLDSKAKGFKCEGKEVRAEGLSNMPGVDADCRVRQNSDKDLLELQMSRSMALLPN